MSTATPPTNEDPSSLFEDRLQLPLAVDARGTLVPVDFEGLPFVPRRLIVVRDVPVGGVRGQHAHRSASQALVCLGGRIRVELRRWGKRQEVMLEGAGSGLLLAPRTWSAQTYLDPGSMLLLLASEAFDPASYIDDVDC